MSFTSFIEYFLANGIFRFRIPMLFLISGYLYALYDQQPNKERVKKRVRTLLWPYLIWSGFFIAVIYICEMVPSLNAAIVASHTVQIDQTRMTLHEYHWYEFLIRWIFFPLPYQLWFIRVLFFYNLCYPIIHKFISGETSVKVFFSIAFFLWLINFPPILFDGEGLLFFSLGVWMQKTAFNIDQPNAWLQPSKWGFAFIAIATIKTWLAFTGELMLGDAIYPVLAIMHKFVVASGLITAWFGLNALVRWCMARAWFVWLSGFSFMIYALHAPLVAIAIDPFYQLLNFMPGYQLLTFILLPTSIIVVVVLVAATMRRLFPAFYSLLTGGRGL